MNISNSDYTDTLDELIENFLHSESQKDIPNPTMHPVTPTFETDELGLVPDSFDLRQPDRSYKYAFVSFNFDGHKVFVLGSLPWVISRIRERYEYDVFEVGFDEVLLCKSMYNCQDHLDKVDTGSYKTVESSHCYE